MACYYLYSVAGSPRPPRRAQAVATLRAQGQLPLLLFVCQLLFLIGPPHPRIAADDKKKHAVPTLAARYDKSICDVAYPIIF